MWFLFYYLCIWYYRKMKRFILLLILCLCIFPLISSAEDATPPIRILIVPGHDNEVYGAEYGNIKEADMNLVLATQIYNILKKDKRLKLYITRDSKDFVREFKDYFVNQKDKIIAFKTKAKKDTQVKVDKGTFVYKKGVGHNQVNQETAIGLYGINMWANENKIDLVINVHFNDITREDKWSIGTTKGFAIYVPGSQMANNVESTKLGESIKKELLKKYSVSNLPVEKKGVIADQTLIALGASNTLVDGVKSVLIEYGYIYQKIFRNSATRHQAYKDMALLTSNGILNYLFKK